MGSRNTVDIYLLIVKKMQKNPEKIFFLRIFLEKYFVKNRIKTGFCEYYKLKYYENVKKVFTKLLRSVIMESVEVIFGEFN